MTFITTFNDSKLVIGNGKSGTGLSTGAESKNETIIIPKFIGESQVKILNKFAFQNYANIIRVIIEADLETISCYCFHGCLNMYSINIPSSLITIENNAFDDCYKLEKVVFDGPSSLKKIGMGAFNTCERLSEIYIPSSVKEIEHSVLTEISVNLTVYYCGKNPFSNVNFFDSNKEVKIIVPKGGVKTFSGRPTTYGVTACNVFDIRHQTCNNKKRCSLSYIQIILLCLA